MNKQKKPIRVTSKVIFETSGQMENVGKQIQFWGWKLVIKWIWRFLLQAGTTVTCQIRESCRFRLSANPCHITDIPSILYFHLFRQL